MYAGNLSQQRRERGSVAQFREGLFLLSEGVGFLRRERRLWPLAVVPVLFSAILVGIAVSLCCVST